MSNLQFVSGRRTYSAAALLSLVVLAGCGTSDSGSAEEPPVTANAGPDAGALLGTAPPEPDFNSKLINVGDRVHFALDRYELSPAAQATLRQQAALLQNHPQTVVTIEGHADERGTREYNLALGDRRAEAVRSYLMALGVAADRVTVISYGKERPECPQAAESCWGQNRRGVTVAGQ